MTNGFISVSEPLVYSQHQSFSVKNSQRQYLCVLKGCIRHCRKNFLVGVGSVINLGSDMIKGVLETKLIAVEDSVVVIIESSTENDSIDLIMNRMLTSVVDFVAEAKDSLIYDTTS